MPLERVGRREIVLGVGAALTVGGSAPAATRRGLAAIEASLGGRLGVHAYEVGAGRSLSYRPDDRFAMCSSFKVLLAAAVLERVDQGRLALDRRLPFGQADLLDYAPAARAHLGDGAMSLQDLCAAAVELSDNTAANLLLALIGGPAVLTARLRAWGDPTTRLDRNEPTLNSAIPGDPRDTTSPRAMASSIGRLLLGRPLTMESRALLRTWMLGCQTGLTKLRAGLPAGLVVGDKTGSNGRGAEGDVAVVESDGRTVLIAAYLAEAKVDQTAQDSALAGVGRLAAAHFDLAAHD